MLYFNVQCDSIKGDIEALPQLCTFLEMIIDNVHRSVSLYYNDACRSFRTYFYNQLSHCWIPVFPFQYVAPFTIPRTHRQDTRNILHVSDYFLLLPVPNTYINCNAFWHDISMFLHVYICPLLIHQYTFKTPQKMISLYIEI